MQIATKSVLPEGFDGVVRFTNWSDEEFVGVWDKKEYKFPALSRSALVIENATPVETLHIAEKMAKKLAEREYFKSAKYEMLREREGIRNHLGMIQPTAHGMSHAGQYSEQDLATMIKKALAPLPEADVTVAPIIKPTMEDRVHKDEDGSITTAPIKTEKDLEKLAKG